MMRPVACGQLESTSTTPSCRVSTSVHNVVAPGVRIIRLIFFHHNASKVTNTPLFMASVSQRSSPTTLVAYGLPVCTLSHQRPPCWGSPLVGLKSVLVWSTQFKTPSRAMTMSC